MNIYIYTHTLIFCSKKIAVIIKLNKMMIILSGLILVVNSEELQSKLNIRIPWLAG